MKKREKVLIDTGTIMMFLSVCYIAFGLVLLLVKEIMLSDICKVLGVILLIIGLVQMSWYLLKKGFLIPNNLGLSLGLVLCIIGGFALIKTEVFASAFGQILALAILFDSIVKVQFSMDLLRMEAKQWWIILILALLMAVLGIIILVNPFGDQQTVHQYTYVVLIIDGIVNMITMIYLTIQRRKYPLIEGE